MAARRPAEVFPPGDFLREELEGRGWTQSDLAEILDRPPRLINEIVMGKRGISPETAKGLAEALGTSAEFWMNLDAAWQLWKGPGGDSGSVAQRARAYELAPVREMMRRGWIESTHDPALLDRQLCNFFEVSSLDEDIRFPDHAARKSTSYAEVTAAHNAWLFRARQLARAAPSDVFSPGGLLQCVGALKHLLFRAEGVREAPGTLAQAGVRFVVVEPLPGSRIDGACFWLENSPVLVLSLRFDRIDNFWFTLFHEIGHIQRRDRVALDVDLEKQEGTEARPESERDADRFAWETILPEEALERFIEHARPRFSLAEIETFAQQQRVHPGLVVGQLQHRGAIPYSRLRRLLVPVRSLVMGTAVTDGWGVGAALVHSSS